MGEEDKEEFQLVLGWLRGKSTGDEKASLREVLVQAFRVEEQERIEAEEQQAEEEKVEENPTRLMVWFNQSPKFANWEAINSMVFDLTNTSWMLSLAEVP